MIIELIIKLLTEYTGKNPGEITAQTSFESLGIDSLDTVDLLMSLEAELGVELELAERPDTVGQLAKLLQAQVPEEN